MVNIAQFGEKALRVAYRLESSSWARFNASCDSISRICCTAFPPEERASKNRVEKSAVNCCP
jgi:hypothetical protein